MIKRLLRLFKPYRPPSKERLIANMYLQAEYGYNDWRLK